MIHLFKNVSLTPDCALYKTNKWVLVGSTLANTYEELIKDTMYVKTDEENYFGLADGVYTDFTDFKTKLTDLISNETNSTEVEVVSTKENFWPIYVSVLRTALPNLDATSLFLILTCAWYKITYLEPFKDSGVNVPNTRADLSNWLTKPTQNEVNSYFNLYGPLDGVTIPSNQVSWEFQIAKLLSGSDDGTIQAKAEKLTKKVFWSLAFTDRINTFTRNLPDAGKLTGEDFDVDQDFDAYQIRHPEIKQLFDYLKDKKFTNNIDLVSDDEIMALVRYYFKEYIPQHYDTIEPSFAYLFSFINDTKVDWLNCYMTQEILNEEFGPLHAAFTARSAFYERVDSNLLSYIFSIKDSPNELAKFSPV